jgi:hypothetical protein
MNIFDGAEHILQDFKVEVEWWVTFVLYLKYLYVLDLFLAKET